MVAVKNVKDFCASCTSQILLNVLKQGPMPKHVGIIMDGNRRFARKTGLASTTDGHQKGEKKLTEMMYAFSSLGVSEVSVYSFSTENLKRSKEEVEGLMQIMTDKIQNLLDDLSELEKHGVAVDVIGDYIKTPKSQLRALFCKLMWSTKENKRIKLNFAFGYSAQEEMATGLNILLDGLKNKEIKVCDLTNKLVDRVLTIKSASATPVDLLIRPGGDRRFSDFMMWECSRTYMEFIENVTWPEVGKWHLGRAIWHYQMQMMMILGGPKIWKNYNADSFSTEKGMDNSARAKTFLQRRAVEKWAEVERIANE